MGELVDHSNDFGKNMDTEPCREFNSTASEVVSQFPPPNDNGF